MAERTHYGDPCIHCGLPHDAVPVGDCNGASNRAIILRYAVVRQAWQNGGVDLVRLWMSDGTERLHGYHPSEHWPYRPEFQQAKVVSP